MSNSGMMQYLIDGQNECIAKFNKLRDTTEWREMELAIAEIRVLEKRIRQQKRLEAKWEAKA